MGNAPADGTHRAGGDYLSGLFGLTGATAVVTGGTSGLGAAVAQALGAAGAEVVVVGRDAERATDVVERMTEQGSRADYRLADVGRPAEVERLAGELLDAHPDIDILINAAGICPTASAVDVALADWDAVFDVNVRATFLMCQALGRHMIARGSGKIVNFASTDALLGVPNLVAYAASKGAVVQMTRCLAVEWIKHGVNVNCVAPTEFATPMVEPLLADPEYVRWVDSVIPIGRIGQPRELASAVLFLVAPSSSMVVGHTLLVDGGRTVV